MAEQIDEQFPDGMFRFEKRVNHFDEVDGSAPDSSSPIYSGPIFVDDTVTIRTRAFASGKNPSAIVGATYTYDNNGGVLKGDSFANPMRIYGSSGLRIINDNSAYTVEHAEPNHTGYRQYHTIWFQWTAPGSGTMTFSTSIHNSTTFFFPFVAIYAGDSLGAITRLSYSATMTGFYTFIQDFPVEQGVTYRIVGMTAQDSYTGVFTLSWNGELSLEQPAAFRIIIR